MWSSKIEKTLQSETRVLRVNPCFWIDGLQKWVVLAKVLMLEKHGKSCGLTIVLMDGKMFKKL